MKKRIVSFLLALVMTVSLLPVSAFAVDDVASSDVPAIVEQEPLEGEASVEDEEPVQEDPATADEPQQDDDNIDTPTEPEQQTADQNMIAVQAATEPEQVNGVYQIKTAGELVWFQKQVSGGQTSINATLVSDIDLSSVCNAELGNWTPIPAYAGKFDGNGHVITNLYIGSATVAKQGLFAELSAAGIVKNLGIKNSSVTMTTAKKINNANAAILVGYNKGGTILNCYVADSSVTTNATSTGKGAAICGNDQGGHIGYCYSIGNTITEANNKGHIAGIVGYLKGSIENCYVAQTSLNTTSASAKSVCGVINGATYANCYYLNTGKADDIATAKDEAWFKSDEAVNALGSRYFAKDIDNKNNGYPVLTFSEMTADKSALKTELDRIPTSGFYTENDRYNGIHASENGFWADMLVFIKNAQDVYDNENATQGEVDRAAATLRNGLQAFLDNLIPADRANTTALYEALQAANVTEQGDYSAKSWAAYKTARDKAKALMDSMFHDDGSANLDNNTKDKNTDIQTMAAELETARKALDFKVVDSSNVDTKLRLEAIQYLAKKYDPDALSGYTDESMAALRETRTAAQKLASGTNVTDMGQKESVRLTAALLALRRAVYGLETVAKGEITVQVSVLDTNDVYRGRGPEAEHNQDTYTGTLTLAANASAYDTLNSRGLLTGSHDIYTAEAMVYLNGELLNSSGMNGGYNDIHNSEGVFQAIKLHNGDKLTVVWIYPKLIKNSSGVGSYAMFVSDNPDWFRYSTISAPLEVAAGEPFSVSVISHNALPFHGTEGGRNVSGAKVYRSEAAATAEDAATGYVGVDTYAETDDSGKATLTLYNEGYVLLNAFRMDDEGRYTVGASVLVHVTAASDLNAVKAQLRKELDAVYYDEQHPESVFTAENWQKVQDAYNTAVKAIDAAKTTGDASAAQQAAIKTIKDLQKSADSFNTYNLASFRQNLNELPDDVTKLDQNVATQIEALKKCYDAMSPYQRSQLTGKEQKKYDAIIKAYDKGLDAPHSYQMTFRQQFDNVPAEDQAALERMIAYLQEHTPTDDRYTDVTGGNQLAKLFSFNTTRSARYGTAYDELSEAAALTRSIFACVNPDYVAYLLCRDAALDEGKKNGPGVISDANGHWSISDESTTMYLPDANSSSTTRVLGHMTYTVNNKQYAIRSISVSGLENGYKSRTIQFYDASGYKGRGSTMCNQVVPDAFLQFDMGFDDVTVTVTWAQVTAGNTELDVAKAAAIAHLKTVRDGLTGDGVQAAHDAGVAAINAAKNTADVDKAYQAAVKNMRAAASSYGTVYVTVENSTFPKEDWGDKEYWDGLAVDKEPVTLTASSTMMSCVKEALENWGYSQEGAESNYISSITVYGRTLAQIDGGPNSGWMGALNDWFTNEGFSKFTVANGTLTDGDVIHIMYTRDLGVDLDGTWGNSDTTLKALEVKNGELLGEFASGKSGGSYEYVLAINGDEADIQLTPTAANKNFLTKIFLNEKVTDNTEGISFYKRTQSIPVKAGDVIYVGCGERAWPTMNNQAGNTQENEGTWYALRVVNANGGADVVKDMINALPATVSYENYPTHAGAVAAARAAYEVLSESEKAKVDTKKLEALEKAIAEFQAIDELKDMLDKLPDSGKLTIKDRSAVEAAQKIYDQLTDAQKDNLTFVQLEKMQELSERMAELIKQNPDPTPTDPDDDNNDNKPNRDHHRRGTTANSTSDAKTNGKDVKSGNTGDAGITLYLGMGLVAILAGAAVVARKRKENE